MKVVIVKEIDEMPADCDSCPFQDFSQNCGILGEYTMLNEWVEDAPYYDLVGKGDCPLKPLPERWEGELQNSHPLSVYSQGMRDGFNMCLEEITE